LELGASKVDITPVGNVWLGGFAARYKPSEGVHDPLFARAFFLSSGSSDFLFISCDLLNIPNQIYDLAVEKISTETGISSNSILIAATHTHSGPSLSPNISSSKDNSLNSSYYKSLPGLISEAGIRAVERAKGGYIGFGSSDLRIGFNRRKKEGPIDPELIVAFATDYEKNPIAAMVNYACHGVVLGPNNYQISADYMGYATRTLESLLGEKFVSLFFNGACGDINPITCVGYKCSGTFDDVERLGLTLSDKVVSVMENIGLLENVELDSIVKRVKVELEIPSIELAEKLVRDQENYIKSMSMQGIEGVPTQSIEEAKAVLSYYQKNLEYIKNSKEIQKEEVIRLQVVRISDYAIVAIPGEPFCEIGLNIKLNSPFKLTSVFSYSNGYYGYIAPSSAYEEGGYEVTPTWWNRLKKGTGEIIVQESLKLLNSLY